MLSEKNKNTTVVKHSVCAILTALCALYQHFALYCYTDGDNYRISTLLNGIYGEDNICQFVHPIVSKAVKALTRVLPSADGFALLCWLFMIMAVYAFLLFVLERARGAVGKAAGVLLVFVWVFAICGGFSCNYTVQAAVVSAAGWVCLLTEIGAEKIRKGRVLFALVMLCFGLMLRRQAACLMLPFAALVMAAQLLDRSAGKEKIAPVLKRYLKFLTPVLLAFAVLTVTQRVVLYSPRYRDSTEYNAVRTKITDYPLLPYDQTGLTEISANDYYSMGYWTLADTDTLTKEFFEKIAESGSIDGRRNIVIEKQLDENDTGSLIREIFFSIYMTIHKTAKFFLVFLLLEAAVNPRLHTVKKLALVFAYAGAGAMLLYFSCIGRLPERVSLSILTGIILARCALSDEPTGERDRPLHTSAVILLAVFALASCVKTVSSADYRPKDSFMSARVGAAEEEYDGDVLYIWAFKDSERSNHMEKGKLPTKERVRHNIPAGDWMYGQNYYKELLSGIRAENPMKALLYRENTYFVQNEKNPQLDYIVRWLREHYDENTQAEAVGETDGCTVWKFSVADENTEK